MLPDSLFFIFISPPLTCRWRGGNGRTSWRPEHHVLVSRCLSAALRRSRKKRKIHEEKIKANSRNIIWENRAPYVLHLNQGIWKFNIWECIRVEETTASICTWVRVDAILLVFMIRYQIHSQYFRCNKVLWRWKSNFVKNQKKLNFIRTCYMVVIVMCKKSVLVRDYFLSYT